MIQLLIELGIFNQDQTNRVGEALTSGIEDLLKLVPLIVLWIATLIWREIREVRMTQKENSAKLDQTLSPRPRRASDGLNLEGGNVQDMPQTDLGNPEAARPAP